MLRSYAFSAAYWVLSTVYVLIALPFLIFPGSGPIRWIIKSYTRSMRRAMHWFGGIKHEVRGKENLPEGPCVLGAKHQSWGDGFLIYPEVERISFVTGDHLERLPFVGGILRKLGAIVIDTCGGGERKAASLAEGMDRVAGEGRRVLIYPEGHLAPVDYHFRYKAGVWHMARAMNVPVVPVATNIGLFWGQEDFEKKPGTAILEFLEPIMPGESKAEFLSQLTESVETATARLVAEARNDEIRPTVLLPDPKKGELAAIPEREAEA